MKSLKTIKDAGQSVWLDYLSREILESGELKRLIAEDGITGVTSNPTIFQKAIEEGQVYDKTVDSLVKGGIRDKKKLYLGVTMEDVAEAADLLWPVYESSRGRDGFVSIEVSPDLAYNINATMDEARKLFRALGRKNVLVKVPATEPGVKAVEALTAEGVNVNVTLLFTLGRYGQVMDAYIRGLERRVAEGLPVEGVTSFASFFVSRVDTMVDRMLDERLPAASSGSERAVITGLRGKMGVANSILAYRMFQDVFMGPGFDRIRKKGGKAQRLIWGSTGTKDKSYSDVKYVEELVAPMTVNTVPPETMEKFKHHGKVGRPVVSRFLEADADMEKLASLGIGMADVGLVLEEEGVVKFTESFRDALRAVAKKRDEFLRMAA